jgi:probable rRNA maturation factor
MEQAKEYGLWEEKEFYKLVIHSTLHILWYDHETDEDYEVMKPLEDKIAKEVFGEIL